MAFTKLLIESVQQATRSSTSGYQDQDDINRNLEAVDKEITETLFPLYAINGKVQDLVQNFVKKSTGAVVSGELAKPDDYVQHISSSYEGKPMYPRNINEIDIIRTSPIRNPKLESGPYFIYFESTKIKYLPEDISSVDLVYLRRPKAGKIKETYVSDADRDYVTTDVVKEIEWDDRAFNLFYYHMMEKYGFEQNDQLSIEYSQLGINREITKV